jgi:hypothetical protein
MSNNAIVAQADETAKIGNLNKMSLALEQYLK